MRYKEVIRQVTLLEGKKRSTNIAQVSEILRIYNHIIGKKLSPEQRERIFKRYAKIKL